MSETLFEMSIRTARFSADRRYRYELRIVWGDRGRYLLVVMLNPSTADEHANDPTVERMERRARAWGYDGLIICNLFAFRATDPGVMKAAEDPIGGENDETILRCIDDAALTLCAWGSDGGHRGRDVEVLGLLAGCDLYALKVSESTGQPWHPLYLSYSLVPTLWRNREANNENDHRA